MTIPAFGPEKAPTFTLPELNTMIQDANDAADLAALEGRYADMSEAKDAAARLQADMALQARRQIEQQARDAESPAKKVLRAKLIENQSPKERESIAYIAVHNHTKNVAAALRERGYSPERAYFPQATTYIAQELRLVPSKAVPNILEPGWRDVGTPSDDSKPSKADRLRNWIERRSKPEPTTKTVWLTDTKGQLGSSNPMSRTHDMVRGCGFDANGDIYIVDSVNVADRSKASEGSGNRLRPVVDLSTYADATLRTMPSPFSMMRSHVEGVGVPGKDAEGLGYLAFYDHFVASANALYKGLTGEAFSPAAPTAEPTVAEAAATITPPASPVDHS